MLPTLVQFIECELKADYKLDSTEYQIWSFENTSEKIRRVNTCVNVPTEKEIFLTFTNFDTAKEQTLKQNHSSFIHENRHPEFVENFNPLPLLKQSSPYIRSPVSSATGGNIGTVNVTTFAWKTNNSPTPSGLSCFLPQAYDPVQTTLRGVRNLPSGRVLRVWVADSDWDELDPNLNGKLHPQKVNAILDAFYKPNSNLNIYEKVQKLTGSSEWGEHSYSTLLPANFPYLDLVYYDINCDNVLGGTVGFFFSGNNFLYSVAPYSNESLVLFLDSKFYSNREGSTWEVTDKLPSFSINTIAHELQHMIHFYQKSVLRKLNSNTWFNEMMSMAIEDAIAAYTLGSSNNLIYSSNQGLGRFIRNNDCPLVQWETSISGCDIILNYAHVYSYSAFLLRNYGVNLISAVLQNSEVDHKALDLALKQRGSSFSESFGKFGASLVVNPKKGSFPQGYSFPAFEDPGFFDSGNSLSLPAGDPYIFIQPPKIYDALPEKILPTSNLILHWKKKFSGSLQEDLYLPAKTRVTIVIGTDPRN